MKKVTIATDGACIGNPGPGGWACILRLDNFVREMYGSEKKTTNNRMELRAVIEALTALKEPCMVTLYTDSEYVRRGISEWLNRWKANSWKKSSKGQLGGEPVLNQDLWRALDEATRRHEILWKWIKGHAGHPDNTRCDFLARKAAREQISSRGSIQRLHILPQNVPAG
ncbi:MAG TPA: ribonuclease HI [Terriglobia bacterium]|nr:ribonuclease HI [Terriglobia bacterium]